jgi:hypothetical protein
MNKELKYDLIEYGRAYLGVAILVFGYIKGWWV